MKLVKLILVGMIPFVLSGQGDGIPYLSFALQADGGLVTVSWKVAAGNTCEDVQVWRGKDSNNLEEVYTYPGICGDNDSSKTYSYTDIPPSSGVHYFYRIIVITDRTSIKKVLVPPESGLELYPNPAGNRIFLAFEEGLNLREATVEVFDDAGRKVSIIKPESSFLEMDISGWSPGTYHYRADFEGNRNSGTFVIR